MQLEANVDECRIRLPLQHNEYFSFSELTREAIFYKPAQAFSKRSAPYLYKPAVEQYSGIAWDYKKPRPLDEAWFGLKCVIADPSELSDPYFSLNCPAHWSGSDWQIDGSYKSAVPDATIEQIKGEGWNGFLILSPNGNRGKFQDLKFCLLGNSSILMGQSRLPLSNTEQLRILRRTVGSIELLGRRR